jgi:hypothetical protein
MSELSGSLDDFPLPDVLRLLSKGRKQGVLHVYGDVTRGRVYLAEGRVSYATTRDGDDFADSKGSEARQPQERRRIELSAVQEEDPKQFNEYLRSQIVEVLVRLGRETSGSFVFQNGVSPSEPVDQPLTVDELLSEAEAELKEWTRIESIIGSTGTSLTMIRSVEADQRITIDGTAWNALAVMSGAATARDVAEHLGQFEIAAARTMARLVEQGLVELAGDPRAAGLAQAPAPADLSDDETREVLSALSFSSDEAPEAGGDDNADDEGAEISLLDSDEAGSEDPFDSDASAESDEVDDELGSEQPPASELARRWRSLRSGTDN